MMSRRGLLAGGTAGLFAGGASRGAGAAPGWAPLRVGDTVEINGLSYEAQCGRNALAIEVSPSKIVRCTMIAGNGWSKDDPNGNERAELDGWKRRLLPREPIWASWSMLYEPGPWSTSDWCILRQIYPWGGLVLKPDGVLHWTGGATDDPQGMWPTRFRTRIQQGTWIHLVERVVLDPGGEKGHWQSWLNGAKVLDLAAPIGYSKASGYWFKFGIYRGKRRRDGTPADETISVRYANVRFGSEDLSRLIASPEPVKDE